MQTTVPFEVKALPAENSTLGKNSIIENIKQINMRISKAVLFFAFPTLFTPRAYAQAGLSNRFCQTEG